MSHLHSNCLSCKGRERVFSFFFCFSFPCLFTFTRARARALTRVCMCVWVRERQRERERERDRERDREREREEDRVQKRTGCCQNNFEVLRADKVPTLTTAAVPWQRFRSLRSIPHGWRRPKWRRLGVFIIIFLVLVKFWGSSLCRQGLLA